MQTTTMPYLVTLLATLKDNPEALTLLHGILPSLIPALCLVLGIYVSRHLGVQRPRKTVKARAPHRISVKKGKKRGLSR
jgi:hypothetical protein